MIKSFQFYSAGRIIFGSGTFQQIGKLAAEFGKKVLVVTSQGSLRQTGVLAQLEKSLQETNCQFDYFSKVTAEPTVEMVDEGAVLARKNSYDLIIGIGGGSQIDAAKAISGLATNHGSVLDYLEGVGTGATIKLTALPCIAIPTTAGTGAEVTKNAVIASRKLKFKKSLRSPYLIPDIALVDPVLTQTLPPQPTAFSGMDALTQCIESYASQKSQALTDILALQGIKLGARSLLKAFQDGTNLEAREEMAFCSLLSGLSLANAGLGAAHGLGAALGALFGISHGLACAVMLPKIMHANYETLPEKFAQIGEALTGQRFTSSEAAAKAGVVFIQNLANQLAIPKRLGELGIKPADIPAIVKNSGGSSMSGNPRQFSAAELTQLLTEML